MPDILAKGTAVVIAFLLAAAIGILVFTSGPRPGARQVTAEFNDAFPLIEGMHVRVDGAIAGSVGQIEVNDRGNAEVTLILNDTIEEPMGDATAAVRQQDTTGDSYVAFDPGGDPGNPASKEPLGGDGIVCVDHDTCPSTLVAPRLDDLLNAFGPSEQAGVKIILGELSKAMDSRGDDLNEAALELKPAFEAANQALAEVNEQNDALKQLIVSAESVTGQAARSDTELARLVDSLATTLDATAAETDALDAGLEKLPETTRRANSTLAALTRAATSAQPLAEDAAAGAPDLATALDRLPAFLDDASAALSGTEPTLLLTGRLLRGARPSLEVGNKRVVTGAFDLTGATADLLNAILGGEDALPALFDDDSYGEGGGTLNKRGLGAVAVEPGNQDGYPAEHAERNFLRVSAIINCETFGQPVGPGCLDDVLLPLKSGTQGAGSKDDSRKRSVADPGTGSAGPSGLPLPGLPAVPNPELPRLDLPKPDLGLPNLGDKPGKGGGKAAQQAVDDLLDFLLR